MQLNKRDGYSYFGWTSGKSVNHLFKLECRIVEEYVMICEGYVKSKDLQGISTTFSIYLRSRIGAKLYAVYKKN